MPLLAVIDDDSSVRVALSGLLRSHGYRIETFASAEAWRKTHAIKPCGSDKVKIEVLVIDAQNDFCNPKGSLYVAGRSGTGARFDSGRKSMKSRAARSASISSSKALSATEVLVV